MNAGERTLTARERELLLHIYTTSTRIVIQVGTPQHAALLALVRMGYVEGLPGDVPFANDVHIGPSHGTLEERMRAFYARVGEPCDGVANFEFMEVVAREAREAIAQADKAFA